MSLDHQNATVVFLSDPASYGLVGHVERIETHISIVFLVGPHAYKLKKALKLPYVDFSTAEIREEACRQELALNAKTAPRLYNGVRRITRAGDGRLEWDGSGELLDAVVEMARFGQEQLLDRMALSGGLTPQLMTATARMIAGFHQVLAPIPTKDGAANIAGVLEINDAGFHTSGVFSSSEVSALGKVFRTCLARHASLLDDRARAGKIRRCHGDLHLRNICLLDGHPVLFDCIEFNAQIATIDVLYDLAFLLMDLWHRGFADLANLTMNRYLDAANEEDGFCLLPFFMAVRAAVRAHVTATQAEEPGQDRPRLSAEACRYFDLALDLLREETPRLVAIGGLSGSGKSTVADHLAPRFGPPPGARIMESDRIRKAMHGVTAETHLPPASYRPEVSASVYDDMAQRTALILKQGGYVVADAVFDDPARRQGIEQAAGAPAGFCGIWLDAEPALLRQRVGARRDGASDADVVVLSRQLDRRPGDVGWHRVDASLAPDRLIAQILTLARG